jgi:hypothetical protein
MMHVVGQGSPRTEIARVTLAGRTAHGYTVAIWAAGMSCISRHGLPSSIAVVLFAVSATVSFGLVQLVARRPRSAYAETDKGAPHDWRASVHVAPVLGAAAASMLAVPLPQPWCWPAASSVATAAFLLLHGLQDAFWRHQAAWQSHKSAE